MLRPNKIELDYARWRYLCALDSFQSPYPMLPMHLADYWNLTSGGIKRIEGDEPYQELVSLHRQTAVLFNENTADLATWNTAVKANRRWVDELTTKERTALQGFHNYSFWQPLLMLDDPMSVHGYLALFPDIANAEATPDIVWKYENPDSPDQLPGAVDIDTHDTIHVLLGRGALQSDEAFVIGFTMGGTGRLTPDECETFVYAVTSEYLPPYRIDPRNIPSFKFGVGAGKEYFDATGIDLSTEEWSHFIKSERGTPIGKLRESLKIDIATLSDIRNGYEWPALPNGRAKNRLPVMVPTAELISDKPSP